VAPVNWRLRQPRSLPLPVLIKQKTSRLKATRGPLRFHIVSSSTGFPVWLFSCFLRGAIRRKSPRAGHSI